MDEIINPGVMFEILVPLMAPPEYYRIGFAIYGDVLEFEEVGSTALCDGKVIPLYRLRLRMEGVDVVHALMMGVIKTMVHNDEEEMSAMSFGTKMVVEASFGEDGVRHTIERLTKAKKIHDHEMARLEQEERTKKN